MVAYSREDKFCRLIPCKLLENTFKKISNNDSRGVGEDKIDSGAVIISYLKCPIIENLAIPTSSVAKVVNTTTNLLQLLPL